MVGVAAGDSPKDGWSSRSAFILAAIGAAVGLGNIWRFPTLAGESGGGAFVIFYIACVFLLGLPLVLSEIFIGRAGQTDAVGSIRKVAEASNASPTWSVFGSVGAIAAFLILSFYSVVAGWVLYYAGVMGMDLIDAILSGDPFRGALAGESQEAIQGRMGDLFANPWLLLAMHFAFMGATLYIVAHGVGGGLEKAATWLMPAFFVLLVGITIYGAFVGNMGEAFAFLFTPDWSKLTPAVMNSALGQALFSLSLGVAGLITYGSYIREGSKLGSTSAAIAVADTSVALIAGLMIFPIVFAVGLDPAAGPTLVFQSLPFAFQSMPAGALIGFLFFLLILVAAITSSISLLEVPTAYGIGERGWGRRKSALIFGGGAFLIGIACLLGYNVWSDVRILGFWPLFAETDILDTVDGFTGKVMLPLVALLTSIFIGWKADRRLVEETTGLAGPMLGLWRFLIAWVCPIAVTIILVTGLFPSILGG
ncbi:MAG: sodium-dependent transporter [Sphingomonadaceae bacterium]|nr:sodium-dependent transporter [Sphingomonadaceae bacterium]MCB2085840.1 sodium-dependent transporter [Sphingomonadaceae bacterium]MCP5385032.1 sodium-dependent transporter [Altererythrobacter sp.]MCP5391539.1 sodium-dependent transporter [Sphingomonadaceae bacterium]MCP5394895.1 sodium-dependent transporter [Sphingomonadaceae bacterium]